MLSGVFANWYHRALTSLKKLGKYEVLGELGHGAMGIVYRARDPMINRLVALKTITTGLAGDPALLERFYREAQAAGGLQHPNIVTIYDMGQADDVPYIAMELVEGENLEQVIARKSPLPIARKLLYAMQACRAFDFAHKRGIVHRDIKPGNVMVGKDGTVKVVDFGIARVLETSKTQTGMLIGTFAYMSPEQYHGEHANERSDIWSFGVLVYELLCYQRPFTGSTPASLMHSICNEEPPPLSKSLPECTAELDQTVSKMLRKSPDERYDSMEDVLLDLELVCKALQSQSVADLLDQAQHFLDQENFSEARDVLRQALQFEAGNHQARALLDKANAGLKRIQNRPKAQQLVEKGQSLLEQGKLQEAKLAAENALQLDSSFTPAEDLHRAIEKELDRARAVAELLDAARQHLAEGLPDDADRALAKVLEIDPTNTQVTNLQQLVLKEKAEREKTHRLQTALQHARDLWTRQDYAECIRLLQELERDFPSEEEVSRLLDTVREDHLQQEKQQALLQSRNWLAAGDHRAAARSLSDLHNRFPADEEIRRLLDDVRQDERNQRLSAGLAEARSLLAAGHHDTSIKSLTSLRKTFPDEPEILQLLEKARQMRAEQAREKGLAEASKLLEARKFADCLEFLAALDKQFPSNQEILAMQRAVRDQQSKQQKQALLDEARHLLADRRYDASVSLLEKMQADYPAETEITKLLAAAREDLGEQEKQQKLAEARALLAAQAFTEALALLDSLAAAHPKDFAVTKLRNLVEKEQDKHSKAARIQGELDDLKKLMGEKKYPEVIARTKDLLTEFPAEPNFIRLGEFAAERQANIEKEKLLQKTIDGAKALMQGGRFQDASHAAREGLKTFPGDSALQAIREEAEGQQKKQEVRRQIEQRVKDIRVKINREQLSDAIDLAKETIATLGPDTDITHLLNSAEVEAQARDKKRIQERTLETIRTLLASGEVDAAAKNMHQALETAVIDSFDPRIRRLSEQIQEAQIKSTQPPAAVPPSRPPALSKEYAFLQATPLPAPPPEEASPSPAIPAQASASVAAPAPPSAPPIPASFHPSAEETYLTPSPRALGTEMQAILSPTATPAPVEATKVLPAPPPAPVEPRRDTATSALPSAREPRHSPIVSGRNIALMVATVLVVTAVAWFAARRPPQPRPETRSEQTVPSQVPPQAQAPVASDSTGDASLRDLRAKEQQLWDQAKNFVDAGRYSEARQILSSILALPPGGLHRADAQQYLDRTIPQLEAQNAAQNQPQPPKTRDNSPAKRGVPGQPKQNAAKPSAATASRCQALNERVQLGETLNAEERAFLKDSCH